MNTRRSFISTLIKSGAVISLYPLANACSKEGFSPFQSYLINQDLCNGCGDCVTECSYNAIELPLKSTYQIEESTCTECKDCVEVCPQNAILVFGANYNIDEENCVGCGKCIDECINEANCITYEKEEYTIRGKCQNRDCNLECVAICPQGAITKQSGSLAVIDMAKCDRCGKCVAACPHEAINPAKVTMDTDACVDCGKCYPVCDFDAVEKIKAEDYLAPHIDQDLCNNCGDCINACTDASAIIVDLHLASINEDKCRSCGDCVESCKQDAIEKPF